MTKFNVGQRVRWSRIVTIRDVNLTQLGYSINMDRLGTVVVPIDELSPLGPADDVPGTVRQSPDGQLAMSADTGDRYMAWCVVGDWARSSGRWVGPEDVQDWKVVFIPQV